MGLPCKKVVTTTEKGTDFYNEILVWTNSIYFQNKTEYI